MKTKIRDIEEPHMRYWLDLILDERLESDGIKRQSSGYTEIKNSIIDEIITNIKKPDSRIGDEEIGNEVVRFMRGNDKSEFAQFRDRLLNTRALAEAHEKFDRSSDPYDKKKNKP